jgi:hypothetical protein
MVMKGFFKILTKNEWYFVLAWTVFMYLIWLNEIGYGAISLLLMVVEPWLISKAYEGEEKPGK